MSDHTSATTLAGFLLTMNMFMVLRQRRILSYDVANEIVEQALLNLETQQGKSDPPTQQTIQDARGILEHLRKLIGTDRY